MDHQNAQQSTAPSSVTPNQNRTDQTNGARSEILSGSQMWSGSACMAPAQPAPEVTSPPLHREQLHERVEARVAELIRALDGCDDPLAKGERARAISSALETARVAMGGGWENVGENEAALLSQWLQTTADFRLTAAEPSTASQA